MRILWILLYLGGRIWGRQNILCQWANYIGKIIHFVFGKWTKCLYSGWEYKRNLLSEWSDSKHKTFGFFEPKSCCYSFFNYYNGYSGTFYPKDQYNSGRLLIRQVRAYEEQRMQIAKAIVTGIGKNLSYVLYHYYKHDKKR